MTSVVAALAPVFLLILLGTLIKRLRVLAEAYWAAAERLTFYLFFPALIVYSTARADLAGVAPGPMVAALILGVLGIAGVVVWQRRRLGLDGPAFTSFLQGSIRPNTYVGIAAAYALFGEAGLTLVAVCIVAVVPLVNTISVLVLLRYAAPGDRPVGWRPMVLGVARNPIILACLLGGFLNVTDLGLPPLLGPLLDILGRAALPVGLMAVGAGLDLAVARRAGHFVALATAIKLIALPLLTFGLARAFGVGPLGTAVTVMYATLPCSAAAYVMTRQMGGDAALMAGIITVSTLAAMAALPLALIAVGAPVAR